MNDKGITTIILAAGLSERMNAFKPLVKYNGKSFLINILEKTVIISDNIIVVTGFNNSAVESEVSKVSDIIYPKIKTVFNSKFKLGMFSSIKEGLNEVNTNWALVHFVDQPSLPREFYTEIITNISGIYDWIQPEYNGKAGHPVLLNKRIFNKIISADDEQNLKQISKEIDNKLIYPSQFKEVLDNFNYPLK